MDSYEHSYFMSLMIGVVFTCVGAGTSIAGWLNRKTAEGAFRICFGAIFFLVGLTVALGMLRAPKPAENRAHDQEILGLAVDGVQSIILDREYKNLAVDQAINLVQKPITLTKRSEMAAICAALRSAEIMSPNHPAAQWYCDVRFNAKGRSLDMSVSSTSNQGVILWLRETYRCNAMGEALQAIAQDHGFGKLTPAEAAERKSKSDHDDEICGWVLFSVFVAGCAFVFLVVPVFPVWRICRRLGLPSWLALFMLIPLANVILLCIIGFQKSPTERELEMKTW
jgi:hypothetical protein